MVSAVNQRRRQDTAAPANLTYTGSPHSTWCVRGARGREDRAGEGNGVKEEREEQGREKRKFQRREKRKFQRTREVHSWPTAGETVAYFHESSLVGWGTKQLSEHFSRLLHDKWTLGYTITKKTLKYSRKLRTKYGVRDEKVGVRITVTFTYTKSAVTTLPNN